MLSEISDRSVAEHPASGQMLHPNRKLRLALLYVRHLRGLKQSLRGMETLHLREKFSRASPPRAINAAPAFTNGGQGPKGKPR